MKAAIHDFQIRITLYRHRPDDIVFLDFHQKVAVREYGRSDHPIARQRSTRIFVNRYAAKARFASNEIPDRLPGRREFGQLVGIRRNVKDRLSLRIPKQGTPQTCLRVHLIVHPGGE